MPKKKAAAERAARSFTCAACRRRIRVPDGWTRGPAVRRHYWAKHPEVMRPDGDRT